MAERGQCARTAAYPSEWPDLLWVCEDGVRWVLYTRFALKRRGMNLYAGRAVAVKPSKRGRHARR